MWTTFQLQLLKCQTCFLLFQVHLRFLIALGQTNRVKKKQKQKRLAIKRRDWKPSRKGTIITCDFTAQQTRCLCLCLCAHVVCVCVRLIHNLGQVLQDRARQLSLMASAFFFSFPELFNYSQQKNRKTLLPLPALLTETHTHTFS